MKTIFTIGLLSLFILTNAQKLTIFDLETGEPAGFVQLNLKDADQVLETNAEGWVDITPFQNAKEIEFKAIGFVPVIKSYEELRQLNFIMAMEPISFELGGVVISATRWKQKNSEIPAKVIAVSNAELILQNPQNAADVLGVSGRVFIQKSQMGGGSPMIRGFATNRLLYVVDGIRMNTAIFRSGNIQNVISLDPFALEQVEVLFGPGSIIYGSDAVGGIMSFQTLTPRLSKDENVWVSGNGIARYSSANQENSGHVDIHLGWKKWALVSSISSMSFQDLKMGRHGPDEYLRPFYVSRIDQKDVVVNNENPLIQTPSAYSQLNWMQKLRYRPNEYLDIQMGIHGSETSPYARYDRHIRYRNGLPRYGEWSYGPQIWHMDQIDLEYSKANVLFDRTDLKAAYQYFEESRISRNIQSADREIRQEKVKAVSFNWDFIKQVGSRHNLYYGLEGVFNDVVSNGVDEDLVNGLLKAGPSRYPQSEWSSFGVYFTDQFRINKRMLVQAGCRYNINSLNATFDTSFYHFPFTDAQQHHGSLTGSLGLVYRPNDQWILSINGATAFRSPNVDDMGKVFDSSPGSVTVPNRDLKPEYAYNLDFSVAKTWGNWLKVDLTAFYTWLDQAMVLRNFSLNGMDSILYDGELSQVKAIQNAASAYVYGVQAGVELKFKGGFKWLTDINFQKGKEELEDGSNSPLRHAAPFFGVTRFEFKKKNVILEWYLQFSQGYDFDELPEEEKAKTEIYAADENGQPYSPSWYTLNFKASIPINSNVTVSGGMENITDQRYRPYSSGIASPGRNFILAVHCKF